MNALAKLRDLIVGEGGAVPPDAGSLAPVADVVERTPEEQAAQVEAARCKATADDLDTRLTAAVTAVAELTEARSAAARGLAVGETTEAAFAQATAALDAAVARRGALEQLLTEARDASQAAYARLHAASAPRLTEERRQRVAEATERAEAAAQELRAAYREACRATGELAERLDELAALGGSPSGIEHSLDDYGHDELQIMEREGWTVRDSRWLPARRAIVCAVPPEGGAPWPK